METLEGTGIDQAPTNQEGAPTTPEQMGITADEISSAIARMEKWANGQVVEAGTSAEVADKVSAGLEGAEGADGGQVSVHLATEVGPDGELTTAVEVAVSVDHAESVQEITDISPDQPRGEQTNPVDVADVITTDEVIAEQYSAEELAELNVIEASVVAETTIGEATAEQKGETSPDAVEPRIIEVLEALSDDSDAEVAEDLVAMVAMAEMTYNGVADEPAEISAYTDQLPEEVGLAVLEISQTAERTAGEKVNQAERAQYLAMAVVTLVEQTLSTDAQPVETVNIVEAQQPEAEVIVASTVETITPQNTQSTSSPASETTDVEVVVTPENSQPTQQTDNARLLTAYGLAVLAQIDPDGETTATVADYLTQIIAENSRQLQPA